jgi:hypothetical protein
MRHTILGQRGDDEMGDKEIRTYLNVTFVSTMTEYSKDLGNEFVISGRA